MYRPQDRAEKEMHIVIKTLLMSMVLSLSLTAVADEQYFDNSGRDDVLSGGVKMIPIETPHGVFNVWTKRTGNNPRIKLLLLHGGPAATHEYFEAFDSFLPSWEATTATSRIMTSFGIFRALLKR
jgi:hypothetical protein